MRFSTIFKPVNRLGRMFTDPGGRFFSEHVAASEARIELLAPAIRASVDQSLAEILEIHGLGEEIMFARCFELRDAAMAIADIAGAAGRPFVGEAAAGIRAIIDSLPATGLWHTDALNLHISALALLNQDDAPPETEAQVMLTRLRKMRVAIGVIE